MNLFSQHIKANKFKKSEIGEKTTSSTLSFLKDIPFVYSKALYDHVKADVFKDFGVVNYDVKRKIKRVIKKADTHVPIAISTKANVENPNRHIRRLFFKQLGTRYPIQHLHCIHGVIFIKKEYVFILNGILKKLDKKGNPMICCYFSKDNTEALQKYLDKLMQMVSNKIARHKDKVLKLEKCIEIAVENFDKVKKLSTDFMGFARFIHRKMYGYYNKIKSTKNTRDLHKKNEAEILYRWRKKRIREYYANETCYKELGVSLAMYTAKIII